MSFDWMERYIREEIIENTLKIRLYGPSKAIWFKVKHSKGFDNIRGKVYTRPVHAISINQGEKNCLCIYDVNSVPQQPQQ